MDSVRCDVGWMLLSVCAADVWQKACIVASLLWLHARGRHRFPMHISFLSRNHDEGFPAVTLLYSIWFMRAMSYAETRKAFVRLKVTLSKLCPLVSPADIANASVLHAAYTPAANTADSPGSMPHPKLTGSFLSLQPRQHQRVHPLSFTDNQKECQECNKCWSAHRHWHFHTFPTLPQIPMHLWTVLHGSHG